MITFFVTLWLALTLNFIIPRLNQRNPIENQLRELELTYGAMPNVDVEEIVSYYQSKLGLDRDLFTQYVSYLISVITFDFGYSYAAFPARVLDLIMMYLPYSMALLASIVIISWSAGIVVGVILGFKRGTKLDGILSSAFLFLNRMPFYILALLLIYFLAYVFPLFPMSGTYAIHLEPEFSLPFISSLLYHSFLPALSMILVSFGGWMIMMRSTVVNILEHDYLTLAKAKGLKKLTILKRYILRNALLPQVAGLGVALGNVVGGSMVVETLFAYRGLGTLTAWAVNSGDLFVIQGVFFLQTTAVLVANLIVDFLYPMIDPRIVMRG